MFRNRLRESKSSTSLQEHISVVIVQWCLRGRSITPDTSNLMDTTLLSPSLIDLIVIAATNPTIDIIQ